MKKVITVFSALLIVSVAFISFSCDEIISPELADKKVTLTFDVPDTVNIRIFKNYRQLHELTGNEKSVVLRPGSYGLEFYSQYLFIEEEQEVSEDAQIVRDLNYIYSNTAKIIIDVPNSTSIRLSKSGRLIGEFFSATELFLGKAIYKISFLRSTENFEITYLVNYSDTLNYFDLFYNNLVNMQFIKGGQFRLGNVWGGSSENPTSYVTLDDFYIGKYEVTQGLWKSVMGNNPADYSQESYLPVNQVSWYDAVEFCNKLSEIEGLEKAYVVSGDQVVLDLKTNGYRLPTEAEWEYAARGGINNDGYQYSGSDDPVLVAWYDENSKGKINPVGQKNLNSLGLYDMSGNVSEWCWDWYGGYTAEDKINPTGPASGYNRIFRGGDWAHTNDYLRTSRRIFYLPKAKFNFIGFRLARSY